MLAAILTPQDAAADDGGESQRPKTGPVNGARHLKPRGDKDKQRRAHGAVIAPVASSCGATSVRAAISASTSASAPTGAARGSARRMSSVTRRRTTCGTTSPTKPIGPATATAAPQSSAIASRPSSLVWTRLTPRPSATLSPAPAR